MVNFEIPLTDEDDLVSLVPTRVVRENRAEEKPNVTGEQMGNVYELPKH